MSLSVAVVIPTYRRPQFLERALASVASAAPTVWARGGNLEIIVVDDGHDNATRALCERTHIGHQFVRYMRSAGGPRAGASAARHQGILAVKANLIYLLDDDDEFLPNRFNASLPYYEKNISDVVLEVSLRRRLCLGEEDGFLTGPTSDCTDAFVMLLTGGGETHVSPAATSFSKLSYLAVGGYDSNLKYGEDGDLLLRLAMQCRVSLLNGDPVCKITIHDNNSTRPDRLAFWQNIKALGATYKYARAHASAEQREFIARQFAGKLDYSLTRIRYSSPNYWRRLIDGSRVLLCFDWRCLTGRNVRSILVWLFRGSE